MNLTVNVGGLLLLWAGISKAAQDCLGGVVEESTVTKLDFFNSKVATNTLHQVGGELRYEDIGIVRDRPVSLVVTVTSGDYTDIEEVWIKRKTGDPESLNGKVKDSMFGNINLQTVQGKPKSGEGNFRMCFVDSETDDLTKVEQFSWTVYDLDERGRDRVKKPVVKEKFIMDVRQASFFQVWPDEANSEVKLSCEDGSSLPCEEGIRTVFHSSTNGIGEDNPTDPNNLTNRQKARSVTFTFTNTDCWEFTYDHYCDVEQPDYNGPSKQTQCRKYGGGNFLFAGSSDEIVNEGECITPPPVPTTPSPSRRPTASPTGSPTSSPTKVPTSPPTDSPTKSPTAAPSKSPTESPTITISSSPTVSPTVNPTGNPTASPSPAPTTAIELPVCEEDVRLVHKRGVTDLPIHESIRVLKQDTSKVTIALHQAWTKNSNDKPVENIFYSFHESYFDQKCYQATNVEHQAVIDTIQVQCAVTSPYALVEICVADETVLNMEEDDAAISKCCHPELPPEIPVVCYSVEIQCETKCIKEEILRRDLRFRRSSSSSSRALRGSPLDYYY